MYKTEVKQYRKEEMEQKKLYVIVEAFALVFSL
jgi:hypothetical protein